LLQEIAATPGAGPNDMIEANGSLLTLNSASHTITAHSIGADGSLTIEGELAVPSGVVGLADS
jgi:hypothetical protein